MLLIDTANIDITYNQQGVFMKDKIITISEIARSMGIKPEKARAKLRETTKDKVHGRWMFTLDESRNVKRILASSIK